MSEIESENMTYRGDLGCQIEHNTSGGNQNGELVILKEYYHPQGEEIQGFIKESTNSISKELTDKCQEVGYIPEDNDSVICLLLTRTSDQGIYPSNKPMAKKLNTFNETQAVLIQGNNKHKLLISKTFGTQLNIEKKNFYVETGMFRHEELGNYYTCKLHAKNSQGDIKTLLFAPRKRKDYEKLLSERNNLSKNVSEIVGSAVLHSNRIR